MLDKCSPTDLTYTLTFACFFQTRSHHIAQAGPELAMQPRLVSDLQSSYLSLPSAGDYRHLPPHWFLFCSQDKASGIIEE